MKDGFVKLTMPGIDIELPLAVTDPEKVIADSEQRFGMSSGDFLYTDKILQFPRTMENVFAMLEWTAALNQRDGRGWQSLCERLVGSTIMVDVVMDGPLADFARRGS